MRVGSEWGMRVGATVLAGAFVALTAPAALAAAPSEVTPAKYGSKTINVADSWGGAQSCVVQTGNTVTCFNSNAEADGFLAKKGLVAPESNAAAQESSGGFTTMALPDCASGWLCLWEHENGGGKRLIFQDETKQYLGNYNMADKVTSYRNRQSDGGGTLYDGVSLPHTATFTLEANAYSSNIGWFNDRADYVHP